MLCALCWVATVHALIVPSGVAIPHPVAASASAVRANSWRVPSLEALKCPLVTPRRRSSIRLSMEAADEAADEDGEDDSASPINLDDFRLWRDLRLAPPPVPPPAVPGLSRGGAVGGPGRRPIATGAAARRRRLRWVNTISRDSKLRALTFPALTLAAAAVGLRYPTACAPLGSLSVIQPCLAMLMLSMGLSISADDMRRAVLSPRAIALNTLLCFGAMPLVAIAIARALALPAGSAAGLVLLGSVSGGQASNLCALLAGGDLALSVILTISTTLLGAAATPALVRITLGTSVAVDAAAMLRSIGALVLVPVVGGVLAGQQWNDSVARLRPSLPRLGIAALLVLVVGGSANAAALLVGSAGAWKAHAASVLLPVVGGLVAWAVARVSGLSERAERTLAIEAAIKSPTLAFVLASKHFTDPAVVAVPAASMVWLAAVGAAMASVWGRRPPTRPPRGERAGWVPGLLKR